MVWYEVCYGMLWYAMVWYEGLTNVSLCKASARIYIVFKGGGKNSIPPNICLKKVAPKKTI